MVLGGEEGLVCEALVDGTRLDHVSEFKYLDCVLNELDTYIFECRVKVKSLQLECVMVFHEAFLMLVLCMVVRKWYGGRRGLGLGLCRWTTLLVCYKKSFGCLNTEEVD